MLIKCFTMSSQALGEHLEHSICCPTPNPLPSSESGEIGPKPRAPPFLSPKKVGHTYFWSKRWGPAPRAPPFWWGTGYTDSDTGTYPVPDLGKIV